MFTRPDFSSYLIHFTKGSAPVGRGKSNPTASQKGKSAEQRLKDILESKTILASNMPWTGPCSAVCFTECVWSSLFAHAKKYSEFGIGFTKEFIFGKDGNPVFYIRPSLFNEQKWNDNIKGFTTPFAPKYGKERMGNGGNKTIDYSHEREWRVLHNVTFEYSDIAFIILPSPAYQLTIPATAQQEIGEGKILFMSNYHKVEELWPTHII